MPPTYDSVKFAAPTGGEAPSLPPDQLGPTRAQRLRNFLVHNPGRVTARGNIGNADDNGSGSLLNADGGLLLSVIPIDHEVFTTYRALNGAPAFAPYPLTDYWRVPIWRTQADVDLAQPALGATAMGVLDTRTGAESFISVADELDIPGPSWCRVNEAVYAASFGGEAIPVEVDEGTPLAVQYNAVWKFNRGGPSANNGPLLNGPRYVQAVFAHYGRVWAAAAGPPGNPTSPVPPVYDTSSIWYTIPGGTQALASDIAADWTDPVTGELNRIGVGASNDGDFVLGFGRAAGHLVIFKRYSIWILYGTSPANFTLRQLRAQNGCVDFRSIAVTDEGVYFASQRGFELFDGSRFTLLSSPIADSWLPLSNAGAASPLNTHAFIRADPLPNDYIYVSMGTDRFNATPNNATERGWLLHRPSGAWSELHTNISAMDLGPSGHLNRIIYTGKAMLAWGDEGHYARCDDLTYGLAGAGLFDRYATTDYAVDLRWRSRVANVGGDWNAATLQRSTVEYQQDYTPATTGTPAWGTAAILDSNGAVISAAYSLSASATPGPRRSRHVQSVREEAARGEAVVDVNANIGAATTQRLETLALHGATLGYRTSHERTSA